MKKSTLCIQNIYFLQRSAYLIDYKTQISTFIATFATFIRTISECTYLKYLFPGFGYLFFLALCFPSFALAIYCKELSNYSTNWS